MRTFDRRQRAGRRRHGTLRHQIQCGDYRFAGQILAGEYVIDHDYRMSGIGMQEPHRPLPVGIPVRTVRAEARAGGGTFPERDEREQFGFPPGGTAARSRWSVEGNAVRLPRAPQPRLRKGDAVHQSATGTWGVH